MQYDFTILQKRLDKAHEHVLREVATLRTGRATAQLLDPVMVEAYGTKMRLMEVASIQVSDSTLLIVNPWDKSLLQAVEKAIASADLNLNPVVDSDSIRIVIPPLTEETRKEMVKSLHRKIEDGRVMIRTVRADAKREIEDLKGSEGTSEDDISADLDELEKLIKNAIDQLDQVGQKKESELMTV